MLHLQPQLRADAFFLEGAVRMERTPDPGACRPI